MDKDLLYKLNLTSEDEDSWDLPEEDNDDEMEGDVESEEDNDEDEDDGEDS